VTERALVVGRLAAAPTLLRALTADVAGDAAVQAPKPGEWSIVEVVRHLVEGDRDTFLPRLRRMLAEVRPRFDKARPAAGDHTDLPTLVAAFASAREQVIKMVRTLDDAGWAREGISPSRGPLSVETYAATMDAHDTEHLRQIQDVRATLGLLPKRCEARAPMTLPEVVTAMEATALRLAAAGAGLSETQRRHRARPGEWCLNEVMAHLLHTETELFLPRMRRMVAEERPAFESFSPEPWARERDHSLDSFDTSLAAFGRARAATCAFLRGLPPGAGERLGLSTYFGPVTLAQYATHMPEHDLEHLQQMAGCRRAALGG
jgi:hypothetical protein